MGEVIGGIPPTLIQLPTQMALVHTHSSPQSPDSLLIFEDESLNSSSSLVIFEDIEPASIVHENAQYCSDSGLLR